MWETSWCWKPVISCVLMVSSLMATTWSATNLLWLEKRMVRSWNILLKSKNPIPIFSGEEGRRTFAILAVGLSGHGRSRQDACHCSWSSLRERPHPLPVTKGHSWSKLSQKLFDKYSNLLLYSIEHSPSRQARRFGWEDRPPRLDCCSAHLRCLGHSIRLNRLCELHAAWVAYGLGSR